jgi:hypothetical protein
MRNPGSQEKPIPHLPSWFPGFLIKPGGEYFDGQFSGTKI